MTTQLSNRNKFLTESHRVKAGKLVYRAMNTSMRTLDEKARTIEFTSSTETNDRMGDVIRVAGWKLDNFNANPVFLFAHRSEDPPIGGILETRKEFGRSPALVQVAQFATKDVYPFGDTIFKMYKAGFMRAVSVGFMPLDYKPIIDEEGKFVGNDFIEQELFELSAVPVPANPEALGRILRGATEGDKFDGVKLGELFLRDAVERNVIASDEAEKMHKFICGDKNPPWAYSLSGVTFNEEPVVNENKAIEFGEWKEASSVCVKRAEKVVERVERAIASLEEFADNAATVVAITPEAIKAAVREVLKEGETIVLPVKITLIPSEDGTVPDLKALAEQITKSLGDAHDLMKSAHKDMANAHRKTAQAIGHIASAIDAQKEEKPKGEPDEDDTPGAPAGTGEPDADDSGGGVISDPEDGPTYYNFADGVEKSVVPFHSEPLADANATWDASKEMGSTDKAADWKRMSTVVEGDENNKGSYKLPHHKGPEGNFATVKEGVQNALARLDQTQMADTDRAGAKAHLEKHMAEFEKQTNAAEPDALATIGIDTTPEPDVFETLGLVQPAGDKPASESVGGEVPPSSQTSRGTVPLEPTDPVEALLKALN